MSEFHESREGEKIDKAEVIAGLREDPENKDLLLQWLDARQKEVEAANTLEAGLALNIELAEIYRDAGLAEMAREAFADAAEQAFQQRDDEAHERSLDEIGKLEENEDEEEGGAKVE